MESSDDSVEWTLWVKTSRPEIRVKLFSSVCNDSQPCLEDDSDNNCVPDTVYAKVEASQKDIQHRKDKAGTPSTKPKARMLVTSSKLIDGNEVASVRDQSHPSILTLKGTVSVPASHPRGTPPVHTSISETKKQYYKELWRQVEERNQQREQERRRNMTDEQKHNETMQCSMWGMPGSGAPNHHLGTMKRTKSLYAAGILPQEQIRDKGFCGIPFQSLRHEDCVVPKLRRLGAAAQSE